METAKLFNQLIDKFPAVTSLKLWKDIEGIKLIGWQQKHIYICSLSDAQISHVMTSPKYLSCYEEIVSPENIIEIFLFENKYFTVGFQCSLSEMSREALQDMDWEGDLFEETPKKIIKSSLKKRCNISKDSILLAACLMPEGIAFLINTLTSIIVKIINPITLKEIKYFTVRNSSLSVKPGQNVCLMLFVPKEEIEISYVKNWFPEVVLDSFESGLLIISLPECIICGVFLDEIPLVPHYLFSWPFQAVNAQWFCTRSEEPNRIQRKSNLILVFDGGTVVILGQYGGKTLYLPLNTIKNAYVSSDSIVVSDYFDCYSVKTFEQEDIVCLPLKGVLSFCPIPGEKHIILVTSRHRTIYAVNLNAEVKRDKFKMPEIGVFDEFLRKNKYLEQICKKIEERDNYISALSYAMNNSVMNFSFSVQVVLIAGFLHTFRIKLKSENPRITFQSKIWKLVISLYSNDCCFTFVRNLDFDLTMENPYVEFITLECNGKYWDFHIDANLVCYIGIDKFRPTVNIGSVLIDISHFIQPMSSLKIHQSYMKTGTNIKEVLESISTKSNEMQYKNKYQGDKRSSVCSFEIPYSDDLSKDCLVKELLSNCRALWRTSEWNDVCKKDKFQILISGNVFNIEIKQGFLEISGEHVEMCHSLKAASTKLLNKSYKINKTGNNLLLKVDDLLKSLELLQYNTIDTQAIKYKKTLSIYKELKENVIYPLTGIKMNFPRELIEK